MLAPSTVNRQALRDAARGARAAIGPDVRSAATTQACARAMEALADLPAGSTVALYAAMRGELDTAPLAAALEARGISTAYPRIIVGQRPLEMARVQAHELRPGRWKIFEPPPEVPAMDLAELAAVVVPGLVFDSRGYRLGWGAGHYDATLPAAPQARRLGLAFEQQLVEDLAPFPHDIPVHLIATEVALHVGAPAGAGSRGSPSCNTPS